jgi:hypothetical protein
MNGCRHSRQFNPARLILKPAFITRQAALELTVEFEGGRKHLPVATLSRVA